MEQQRVVLVASFASTDLDTDGTFLLDAFEKVGVSAVVEVWNDPDVDWSSYGMAIIRATWDYHQQHPEFLEWVRAVSAVTILENSAEVVEWNLDKRYLAELGQHGFPVIPTRFIATSEAIGNAVAAFEGANHLVVKPSVSAGSKNTERYPIERTEDIHRYARRLISDGRTVMIQPYIDQVDKEGERGLIYIAGEFSHAIWKGPMLGEPNDSGDDLFVRETIKPIEAQADQRKLADAVCRWLSDKFQTDLLYARIDMIDGANGAVLMEVEVIEPSLFHEVDPVSADKFAAASLARFS